LARMSEPNAAKRYNSALEVIKDLNQISPTNNHKELTINDLAPTNVGQSAKDQQENISPTKLSSSSSKRASILKLGLGLVALIVVLEFFFPFIRPNYYIFRGKRLLAKQPKSALNNFQSAIDLRVNCL